MRRKNYRGYVSGILVLAMAICGWAGCSKMSTNTAPSNNEVTYLTLMNLAPYSPPTEIYLNDIKSTSAVAPGNYSTAYARLQPETYDVKFKVAGGDSLLSEIQPSAYDSLNFYTAILYNDGVNGAAKSVKIFDDYSAVTANSSYYRFFQMCPEVPAADLYLNGTLVQPGRMPADIINNTSYTEFQTLTAGSYNVSVKKAGTDSVLYSLSNAPFLPGNAYTIFLSGTAGTGGNTTDPIGLSILKAAY
jgi:Domain of unknown function (DUF4397)